MAHPRKPSVWVLAKRGGLVAGLAVLAGLAGVAPLAASGMQDAPPIERWYGHRRIRVPAPAPRVMPPAPAPRVLKGSVVVWPIDWFSSNEISFHVETPAPVAPAATLAPPEPPQVLPGELIPVHAVIGEGEAIVQAAVHSALPPEELPAVPPAADAKSTEVASLTTLRAAPAAGLLSEQGNETLFYRIAFLQVLTTLAAFIVGPLVLLLMLRLLLRKVLSSNGHLRIELLNQPQLALVGGYAGPIPAAAQTSNESAPALSATGEETSTVAEFTGEYFEMGPTFEEEKAMLEEQLKQQELALMAQITQENLELQQQLKVFVDEPAVPCQETLSASREDAMPAAPDAAVEAPATVVRIDTPPIAAVPEPSQRPSAPVENVVAIAAHPVVQPTDALFAAIANRSGRRRVA